MMMNACMSHHLLHENTQTDPVYPGLFLWHVMQEQWREQWRGGKPDGMVDQFAVRMTVKAICCDLENNYGRDTEILIEVRNVKREMSKFRCLNLKKRPYKV